MLSKVDISRHLQTLLKNQHPDGGFPASPSFPPYRFCWFRDGSFIAHALDLYAESDAAFRFHQWCVDIILHHETLMDQTEATIQTGKSPEPDSCFPCRFTLDGNPLQDGWGNHQLDGLGTWLWAVSTHMQRSPNTIFPAAWLHARQRVAEFLRTLWRYPCYDCWEEYPHDLHTYTLAAVYGGLQIHALQDRDQISASTAAEIRAYVLDHAVTNGHLVKRIGYGEIDASLVGAAIPYGLVDPQSEIMSQTLCRIEEHLTSPSGGVHRYRADTYYGGGEWVLLTAWKGWLHARRGELAQARQALVWVQGAADANGFLPEQTSRHLLAPDSLLRWEQQWGPSASPLLWSHSMVLILQHSLRQEAENKKRLPNA